MALPFNAKGGNYPPKRRATQQNLGGFSKRFGPPCWLEVQGNQEEINHFEGLVLRTLMAQRAKKQPGPSFRRWPSAPGRPLMCAAASMPSVRRCSGTNVESQRQAMWVARHFLEGAPPRLDAFGRLKGKPKRKLAILVPPIFSG